MHEIRGGAAQLPAEMRGMRIRRLGFFLAVAASTVLIGFRGGTASYLLFWASLLPPLFGRIYRRILKERLQVHFRLEQYTVLRGETAAGILTLSNDSALPIPDIKVRLKQGKVRFRDSDGEFACSLRPHEVKELRLELECLHCGGDNVGAEDVFVQDIFALSEQHFHALQWLNVLPRPRHAQDLVVAPPKETERPDVRRGYSGERLPDGQLRPYERGEDVRLIHWKASQRQGRPILRSTVPEPKSELVLIPDTRPTLPEGEAGWLAEDSVVEGPLLAADYFLRHGMPLRVLPDEAREMNLTTPSDYPVLYDLCSKEFFQGLLRPDELLQRDLGRSDGRKSYLLLTWEVDEDFIRRLSQSVDLGMRVSLIYIGDGGENLLSADRRIPVYRVTSRRDVFSVLSGFDDEGDGV